MEHKEIWDDLTYTKERLYYVEVETQRYENQLDFLKGNIAALLERVDKLESKFNTEEGEM